jgi:hypothetical protein
MTGLEALQALREGKKVRRVHWGSGEYLSTYVKCDGLPAIAPSPKYNRTRGENCYYPEDAVLLTDEILDDFLSDDWEVVE